jgi:organic radical activating enzyme
MSVSASATHTKLPVMETFYTLQGEGAHQGKAAFFIRLGGCDVGCVWCDVKESWDATRHPSNSISKILETVKLGITTPAESTSLPLVVITGGEPLLYDLTELTSTLQSAGFQTHLETSGAHPLSGSWNWICLSPKKFKAPAPEICSLAHELKVVIYHPSDFEWAEQYAAKVSPTCRLFLQPEWGKAEKITPMIIEYIQMHPKWTLCLQIHKYLKLP